MKGSQKASISSYLGSLDPSVNCCRIVRAQGSKSLLGIEILCCCVPLLLGSLSVMSIVASPKIAQAQVVLQSAINRPTLKVGSQGEPVSELQAALKLLGFYTGVVDGVYNQTTASAVSQFKRAVGLNPDGVVDATTWQQLFPTNEPTLASSVSSPNSASKFPVPSQTNNTNRVVVPTEELRPTTPTTNTTTRVVNPRPEPRPTTPTTNTTTRVVNPRPEPRPTTPTTTASSQRMSVRQSSYARGSTTRTQQTTRSRSTTRTQQNPYIQYTSEGLPILRVGMRGSEVVRLQQRLQRLGFLESDIDGHFGAATEAAVKAAQQRYGLEADGVVGGATWDILMRRTRS